MLNKTLTALAAASLLLSTAAHAAKPSFKCSPGMHEAEELICQDAELARLDNSLASLYKTVLKNTPKSGKRALKAEQSGWVKGRNDCWKAGDQRGCIKGEYESRIRELKDR
jgi:uncharacterized protein